MHRAKREESYAVDEAIQTDAFATSDVADPALLGLVDAALMSLPERYREAVILRYLQNYCGFRSKRPPIPGSDRTVCRSVATL